MTRSSCPGPKLSPAGFGFVNRAQHGRICGNQHLCSLLLGSAEKCTNENWTVRVNFGKCCISAAIYYLDAGLFLGRATAAVLVQAPVPLASRSALWTFSIASLRQSSLAARDCFQMRETLFKTVIESLQENPSQKPNRIRGTKIEWALPDSVNRFLQ